MTIDFKIRDAIYANVTGDSPAQFAETVEDAISSGDEHLLPGLGVFLEAWWNAASKQQQQDFVEQLANQYH